MLSQELFTYFVDSFVLWQSSQTRGAQTTHQTTEKYQIMKITWWFKEATILVGAWE